MMRRLATLVLCAAAALAQAADKPFTDPTIVHQAGQPDSAKEYANKQVVQAWLNEFWGEARFDSWPKYMKADFRNHDPREPAVGAQALADWLVARRAEGAKAGRAPPPRGPGRHMFLLADGDYVFVTGYNTRAKDPEGDMPGANVIRMENGKIAEWWFIGSLPPANDPAPDR